MPLQVRHKYFLSGIALPTSPEYRILESLSSHQLRRDMFVVGGFIYMLNTVICLCLPAYFSKTEMLVTLIKLRISAITPLYEVSRGRLSLWCHTKLPMSPLVARVSMTSLQMSRLLVSSGGRESPLMENAKWDGSGFGG
jgi:hypothetical protein